MPLTNSTWFFVVGASFNKFCSVAISVFVIKIVVEYSLAVNMYRLISKW